MSREIPLDHPPFAALPVRMITVGRAGEQLAVHVAGRLSTDRVPLLCVPGYTRNMSDFTELVPLLHRRLGADWPIVLVDLRGRGRSSDRSRRDDYTTTNDARDLSEVARALGIGEAIFAGQGHGGQVLMALAATRPALMAAAILIDAGPVAAAQSLIRLRSNAHAIAGLRGATGLTVMLRRMLSADYPGLDGEAIDRLALRSQLIDKAGLARPLFDMALIHRLQGFAHDDVLVPQWQLFDVLGRLPLLLLRTEFTDQVPREVHDEMQRRRPDAFSLAIPQQGSPALLDKADEAGAIAGFMTEVTRPVERPARRA